MIPAIREKRIRPSFTRVSKIQNRISHGHAVVAVPEPSLEADRRAFLNEISAKANLVP